MKVRRENITKPMLERLVAIHSIIKSGQCKNTKEIATELEVGTATISRDIEYLRDRFMAPIEYDGYRKGYYYSEDFDLPLNTLSEQDMEVLTSAKILLSHYKDSPIYSKLCDIIDDIVPRECTGQSMINRIATPPVAKAFYDKKLWTDIYNAMKNNNIIEFDYKGLWRTECTHRRVRPYQLVMDDGQVYLLGYSEEREADRIFSLSRMSNIVITEQTFVLPKDYDFAKKCDNGKFGFYFTDNKTRFKIRFFGVAKQFVKERLWAEDQKIEEGDDYLDLTFSSNQQMKVLHWVLSQGYCVMPLEPESFVDMWKDSVRKMSEIAGVN